MLECALPLKLLFRGFPASIWSISLRTTHVPLAIVRCVGRLALKLSMSLSAQVMLNGLGWVNMLLWIILCVGGEHIMISGWFPVRIRNSLIRSLYSMFHIVHPLGGLIFDGNITVYDPCCRLAAFPQVDRMWVICMSILCQHAWLVTAKRCIRPVWTAMPTARAYFTNTLLDHLVEVNL